MSAEVIPLVLPFLGLQALPTACHVCHAWRNALDADAVADIVWTGGVAPLQQYGFLNRVLGIDKFFKHNPALAASLHHADADASCDDKDSTAARARAVAEVDVARKTDSITNTQLSALYGSQFQRSKLIPALTSVERCIAKVQPKGGNQRSLAPTTTAAPAEPPKLVVVPAIASSLSSVHIHKVALMSVLIEMTPDCNAAAAAFICLNRRLCAPKPHRQAEMHAEWWHAALLEPSDDTSILERVSTRLLTHVVESLMSTHVPQLCKHLRMLGFDMVETFSSWISSLLCGQVAFPRPTTTWIINVAALHGWPAVLLVFLCLLQLIERDLLECTFADAVRSYLTRFPRRKVLQRSTLVAQVENGPVSLGEVQELFTAVAAEDDARAHGLFAGEIIPTTTIMPMTTKGARKGAAARFDSVVISPVKSKKLSIKFALPTQSAVGAVMPAPPPYPRPNPPPPPSHAAPSAHPFTAPSHAELKAAKKAEELRKAAALMEDPAVSQHRPSPSPTASGRDPPRSRRASPSATAPGSSGRKRRSPAASPAAGILRRRVGGVRLAHNPFHKAELQVTNRDGAPGRKPTVIVNEAAAPTPPSGPPPAAPGTPAPPTSRPPPSPSQRPPPPLDAPPPGPGHRRHRSRSRSPQSGRPRGGSSASSSPPPPPPPPPAGSEPRRRRASTSSASSRRRRLSSTSTGSSRPPPPPPQSGGQHAHRNGHHAHHHGHDGHHGHHHGHHHSHPGHNHKGLRLAPPGAYWTLHTLVSRKESTKIARAFDLWKAVTQGTDPGTMKKRLTDAHKQNTFTAMRLEAVERSVKIKLSSLAVVEKNIRDDLNRVREEEREKIRLELDHHRRKVAAKATRKASDDVVAHYEGIVADLKASHRRELASVVSQMERKNEDLRARVLDLQRQLGQYQVTGTGGPDTPKSAPLSLTIKAARPVQLPDSPSIKVLGTKPAAQTSPGARSDGSGDSDSSVAREALLTHSLATQAASLRKTLAQGHRLMQQQPESPAVHAGGASASSTQGQALRQQMDQAFSPSARKPAVSERGSINFGHGWKYSQHAGSPDIPISPAVTQSGEAQPLQPLGSSMYSSQPSGAIADGARPSVQLGGGWKFSATTAMKHGTAPDAGRQDWRERAERWDQESSAPTAAQQQDEHSQPQPGGTAVVPAPGFEWPDVFQSRPESYTVNHETGYHYHPASRFYYNEPKNLYYCPPGFSGAGSARQFFFLNPETLRFEVFDIEQRRADEHASKDSAGSTAKNRVAKLTVRSALASAVGAAEEFTDMQAQREAATVERAARDEAARLYRKRHALASSAQPPHSQRGQGESSQGLSKQRKWQ